MHRDPEARPLETSRIRRACACSWDTTQGGLYPERTVHLSVTYRDLDLDLDRSAPRQCRHADRGSAVATGVAEDVEQEPARTVDDSRLLYEARRRGDEPEHGEHAVDALQCTELVPQHRQCVQGTPTRGLHTLLDSELVPEHTWVHEVATVVARELTRGPGDAAVHDDGVEWLVRRVRARQREAERGEPCVDAVRHGRRVSGADGWSPRARNSATAVPS